MFSRTGPAAIKPDLNNTIDLCAFLKNPQQHFKCIHIAGTNGKGSVSHMLASVLQEQGYKTGLYTSPHIKDFRERIRINGAMISEKAVIDFTESIQTFVDQKEPSFFEVTVGMAFKYFADEGVDIAVIETGLGGRLDSTNIIDPEISVITNIGFDHTALLGNTFEAIAGEKAGIIKKGKPVVIGRSNPSTKHVFLNKAKEMNSPIQFAEEDYQIKEITNEPRRLSFQIISPTGLKRNITSKLNGIYQVENIRTVVATIDKLILLGWQISEDALANGISNTSLNTGLRGRWETIEENPTVVLDVGHNPDGIQQILEQLSTCTYNQLHIILGLSKDKDYQTILSLLPKNARYSFTQANIPRALDASTLKEEARKAGLEGNDFRDVNDALSNAKENSSKNDLILICGSVFVIGELKSIG
jgi:dihydrofolate synthase/folylpolyglutamate synthase